MNTLKRLKPVSHNLLKLVVVAALLVLATAAVPENLTRINTTVATVLDGRTTSA